MRVLISGANGFVGTAVCAEVGRRGHVAVRAVREAVTASRRQDECVVGEVGPHTEWMSALRGVDVVIHLAARVHVIRETASDPLSEFRRVNVAGTERLARAAAACGVRRFVYVSSVGVHGRNCASEAIREEDPPSPHCPYARSKWEAEELLVTIARQTGIQLTVVRPPLVYGPNNPGNFLKLLNLVDLGLPLPLGSVENLRSMIYVGNLADALTTCAVHSKAAGRTYLVSDGENLSTPQLIRKVAQLLDVSCILWPFPPKLLRMTGKLAGISGQLNALVGSLVVDGSRIRNELNWRPPFTLDEGLRETVRWFQRRPQ
jgi:nucleoside-diphosphate-sugar epimerase